MPAIGLKEGTSTPVGVPFARSVPIVVIVVTKRPRPTHCDGDRVAPKAR